MGNIRWYETRYEIAKFALPLLKQFQVSRIGYPGDLLVEIGISTEADKRWSEILADMESAMQTIIDGEILSEDEQIELQRKLELFGKWFFQLWD